MSPSSQFHHYNCVMNKISIDSYFRNEETEAKDLSETHSIPPDGECRSLHYNISFCSRTTFFTFPHTDFLNSFKPGWLISTSQKHRPPSSSVHSVNYSLCKFPCILKKKRKEMNVWSFLVKTLLRFDLS